MPEIINSEKRDDYIIISMKFSIDEAKALKGCMENIHVIPEEHAVTKANVYERGRKKH